VPESGNQWSTHFFMVFALLLCIPHWGLCSFTVHEKILLQNHTTAVIVVIIYYCSSYAYYNVESFNMTASITVQNGKIFVCVCVLLNIHCIKECKNFLLVIRFKSYAAYMFLSCLPFVKQM
jgi:hypothetical protein